MNLVEATNMIKPCISTGDVVQILSYICFSKKHVTAYNGNQAMIVKTQGIDNISCVVPGIVFAKLISSLPPSATVSHDADSNILHINSKATKGKMKLSTMPVDQFIFDKSLIKNEPLPYIATSERFLNGIRKCKDTVSDNEAKPAMTGITVEVTDDNISMYSTDSIQLSRYILANKHSSFRGKIMLPIEFCNIMVGLTNKGAFESAKIMIGRDTAYIQSEDKEIALFTHVIPDLNFLSFENTIKENYNKNVETHPIPDTLDDSLVHSMLILEGDDKKVNIITHEDQDYIELVSNSTYGNANIKVPFPRSVDNDFVVNGDSFRTMLKLTKEIAFVKKKQNNTVVIGKYSNRFLRIIACFTTYDKKEEE